MSGDMSTAIECLFDDLHEIKGLIREVRDALKELLDLLHGTEEGDAAA